jgi:hypothetical protein
MNAPIRFVAIGLAVSATVAFASVLGRAAVARDFSASAAGEEDTTSIEDYSYPNADRYLADKNVKLVSGDGRIVIAECDDPPQGDIGVIKVYTSDPSINHGGLVCFKVLSSTGQLTMEVPSVFEIRGDGQRSGTGHEMTATVTPEDGPKKTVELDPDGSIQVGIGTTPPGPPDTLLELKVTVPGK